MSGGGGTKGQGGKDERRGRRKSKRRDAVRDSEQVGSQGGNVRLKIMAEEKHHSKVFPLPTCTLMR